MSNTTKRLGIKAETLALAERYNIEVDTTGLEIWNGQYYGNVMVNLPEGYLTDDYTTGYSGEFGGATYDKVWRELRSLVRECVAAIEADDQALMDAISAAFPDMKWADASNAVIVTETSDEIDNLIQELKTTRTQRRNQTTTN